MPYVITLTGPSRSGKSLVIRILKEMGNLKIIPDFNPILMQKYTTRIFRENEIALTDNGKSRELDVKAVFRKYNIVENTDIEKSHAIRMDCFKRKKCDLAYEQYGDRYGIKSRDVYGQLAKGFSPIIILNDVRTVEDLKVSLGEQCKSIFIFRETPELSKYLAQGAERNESEDETKRRFNKAEAIYRIYIENIHIFDKLILNVQDGEESLRKILENFILSLHSDHSIFV